MKKQLLYLVAIALFTQSFVNAQDYALEFDGIGSRVMYNSDATLGIMNGASDYTIEAWIKPTSDDIHNNTIIKRYYQFALFMYQDANRRVYFTHYTNAGTTTYVNSLYNVINIGEWNHVVVISNATEDTLKLYVNGVDVTADSSGNAASYPALTLEPSPDDANDTYAPNFYVGYSGSDAIPTAYIDKVRVKLLAEDIADLQTSVTDAAYVADANTAILMNFDEGTGVNTLNEAPGGVNAELQCYGGCDEIPVWVLLADTLATTENATISFSVYPNPATGNSVTVQSPAAIQSVVISDLLGKVVFAQSSVNATQLTINTELNAGMYLMNVSTSQGNGTQKLIIQ